MPTYSVFDPASGKKIKITGDSPPTESELNEIFSSVAPGQIQPQESSLLAKGFDALTIPEKKSREGLQMIAKSVTPKTEVTGNLARDVAMNTPKIAAETLAEVAPGFISRGTMLTAGGLKAAKAAAPLIKMAGKGAAKVAESVSGLEYKTPGVLSEVAANPKILFAKGTKAVRPMYEAAKKSTGQVVSEEIGDIDDKLKMVKTSYQKAKDGTLNAIEALEARKILSNIKKAVPDTFFRKVTESFNKIAKPVFEEADKAYETGVKADAIRTLLPVNKSGGTSIAKMFLGSAAAGFIPGVGLKVAAMSPLVQGATAAGVGTAAKLAKPLVRNPVTTAIAVKVAEKIMDLPKEKALEYLKKAMEEMKKVKK